MYYVLVHYPINFELPNILTIKPNYLSFATLKVCPTKEWKSFINPKPSRMTNLSVFYSEAKCHRLVILFRNRISSMVGIILLVCLFKILLFVCGVFLLVLILNYCFGRINLKRIFNVRIFLYQ